MDPDYFFPILMWACVTGLMAFMGLDTFDRPMKNRRLFAYTGLPEELSESDKRDRKEGAWLFILSPLAPLFAVGIIIIGIGYLLYCPFGFLSTKFPEMIRALR